MPVAAMAQAAFAKKQENDGATQGMAAQAAHAPLPDLSPNKIQEAGKSIDDAYNKAQSAPESILQDNRSSSNQAPAGKDMLGALGLSPETWKSIGQVGQMIGAARGDGAQMSALPGAPNLGVSFTAPAAQAQYAMMQAPQFSAPQAPQFPYIGVPKG